MNRQKRIALIIIIIIIGLLNFYALYGTMKLFVYNLRNIIDFDPQLLIVGTISGIVAISTIPSIIFQINTYRNSFKLSDSEILDSNIDYYPPKKTILLIGNKIFGLSLILLGVFLLTFSSFNIAKSGVDNIIIKLTIILFIIVIGIIIINDVRKLKKRATTKAKLHT